MNNLLNFVDANLRAKMLGDAIPAESFAAEANQTGDFEIQGDEKRGITSISFLYYLNPISRRMSHLGFIDQIGI